jgi:hypothetical protein
MRHTVLAFGVVILALAALWIYVFDPDRHK